MGIAIANRKNLCDFGALRGGGLFFSWEACSCVTLSRIASCLGTPCRPLLGPCCTLETSTSSPRIDAGQKPEEEGQDFLGRCPSTVLRCWQLSGMGDSPAWLALIDSRESFAIETPIFIARQADSPESLEFPIRANHLIRANRANRFARIMPLRVLFCPTFGAKSSGLVLSQCSPHLGKFSHFSRDLVKLSQVYSFLSQV